MALFNDVARAVFAAPALGGNTQIELDVIKALAFTGVVDDFFVRDAAADANNHDETQTVEFR